MFDYVKRNCSEQVPPPICQNLLTFASNGQSNEIEEILVKYCS